MRFSLRSWLRPWTLFSAPGEPDLYLVWRPEGLYVGTRSTQILVRYPGDLAFIRATPPELPLGEQDVAARNAAEHPTEAARAAE